MGTVTREPPPKHGEVSLRVTHMLRPFPSSETDNYSPTHRYALSDQRLAHKFDTQLHFYTFVSALITAAPLCPRSVQSTCTRKAGHLDTLAIYTGSTGLSSLFTPAVSTISTYPS